MEEHKTEEKKVAVIVPFVSLNDYVLGCIKHCLELNYSNFKLILLPSENILLPKELKTDQIEIIPTGDAIISKKRNVAIKKFPDVDYYAFIDSDAYPHKDWLKNATKAFLKSDKIGAIGGPNIAPDNEPFYQKVVGNASKSFLLSGIGAFCKKISKNRYCAKLQTCNLIVKKEVIMLCNGFNEDVEIGEDQLLCNHIIKGSKMIFYDNTVIVYHQNRSLGENLFSQRIAYGYSLLKVIKKENSLFNLFFLTPAFLFIFLIIGLIFGLFNHTVMSVWLITVGLYLLLVVSEAIRYSNKIVEIPSTLTAILIANLGYPMGIILAAIGVNLNIKRIYKNYREDIKSNFP